MIRFCLPCFITIASILLSRSSDGNREGISIEGVECRLGCVAVGDIISDMVFMVFVFIIGVCDRLCMIMSLSSVGSIINGGLLTSLCKLGRLTLSKKGSWDNDR